ncbi:LPXTG-site transpeptidase (sortase) family protein [Nocardioides sp. J9]|uniref:sortase domain-containing protein n=1 Tax=Nocardioides sp. J9 TaxID=935844 RepID=UPI00119F0DBB|nr:sortase [Nocardioides sp. J9]TWG90876.1 LPXTG-site transpeptidase (sortase) family protein [Nocardioides sp. J9]
MSRTRTRLADLVLLVGLVAGLAALAAGVLPGLLPGLQREEEPAVVVPAPPALALPPAPPVPAAPAPPERVTTPTRIEVPAIGVDEPLTGRGLKDDGSLDTPDFGKAAWYSPGPRPGEPGGAVVVAHVHGPDGPDVFWDLATLEPGDTVRVHRRGAVATFVVEDVEDVPKEQLPYARIWPATEEPLLRLITCGGTRTADGYPDNTIVYARLVGTERR